MTLISQTYITKKLYLFFCRTSKSGRFRPLKIDDKRHISHVNSIKSIFLSIICGSVFWWRWQIAIVAFAVQFQCSMKEKHVSALQAHTHTHIFKTLARAYKRKREEQEEIDGRKIPMTYTWNWQYGARFFFFIVFFLELPVKCMRVCVWGIFRFFFERKLQSIQLISM